MNGGFFEEIDPEEIRQESTVKIMQIIFCTPKRLQFDEACV